MKDNPTPLGDSSIYTNGVQPLNTSTHRGGPGHDLVVQLAQMVGRNANRQPEPIESVGGGLVTTPGLFGQMGTNLLYYVRDADAGTSEFVNDSQGRVKKIVTFPTNVTPTDIIRITVFYYQNPTYPNKVTTIKDYEEAASYYMTGGIPTYDVNSAIQNNIHQNI